MSGKKPLVSLAAAWKSVMRSVAALLLMMAFATPALAEIACAGESVQHLQQADGSAIDLSASDHGDSNDNEDRDQAGHCAFSHGHCSGMPLAAGNREALPRMGADYTGAALLPLKTLAPNTLERPPSA